MADLVSLIWMAMNVYNPTVITGPHFSDVLYDNHAACKTHVARVTKSVDVFTSHNEFTFGTPDGTIFKGGCYTASEWEVVKAQLGLE